MKGAIENLKPVLKTGHIAPGFNVEGELLQAFFISLDLYSFVYSAVDPLAIGDISVNPGFELKISGNQIYGITDFKIDKLRLNVDKVKVSFLPPVFILQNKILKWFICLEAGDALNTP